MPQLASSGVKIVDLSADFRLKDPADYETWYGYTHPSPELLDRFVYAVPELNRDAIAKTSLAASPGCMAIASILALAPLFKQKEVAIDRKHVVVDAKIASSGSGGKPSLSTHFSERYGVVRPYKPAGHRHTGEIEQQLSWLAGEKVTVSMSAHAINMVRGILSTCHVFYAGRHPELERLEDVPLRLREPALHTDGQGQEGAVPPPRPQGCHRIQLLRRRVRAGRTRATGSLPSERSTTC